MARLFHFGPYVSVAIPGLGPGESERWSFGPYDWDDAVVTVTAHPLGYRVIGNRRLAVTDIEVQKVATGEGERHVVHCRVHNRGEVHTNYSVWVGGTRP